MVSNQKKWIPIFDVPEIGKHKKGFTVYKIVSMLYPETNPDAITKITVWKRFNDFKKLHKEIKLLHSKLGITNKCPNLPRSTFFKRFDEEIVQDRKENILLFLEYVGSHSQLFTSNVFVKFFETSHTPVHQQEDLGNIDSIRANLHLPDDPEYIFLNSDDDHTISDTDSVTTLNSFSYQNNGEVLSDSVTQSLKQSMRSSLSRQSSLSLRRADTISISTTIDSLVLMDDNLFSVSTFTSDLVNDEVQYLIDASVHVNMAKELENDKKYEEAFAAYKTAIDILLKYGKDDKDYERKQMVKYKTEKYLIRAEKIHNMYLTTEMKNLKQLTETKDTSKFDESRIQRPISDLYKYKVVRIIENGMLVLHSELQQLFFMKVIPKNVMSFNDKLILPENVPYMIKLHNYYNCENALFLVVSYCSGKKLWDYIRHRSENPDDVFYPSKDQILREVQNMDIPDPESELSYSDVINDYAKSKKEDNGLVQHQKDKYSLSSDDSFEKVTFENLTLNRNLMDEPIEPQSLQAAIKPEHFDFNQTANQWDSQFNETMNSRATSSRKNSQMSSVDELDLAETVLIPMKVIVRWSAQLILALEKLHILGIKCCDLQSHNILIDENGDLILTYMCNVNEVYDVFTNGNSMHIAPEIYRFEPITEAVDWWCFGAILYELLVGMPLSCIHPDAFMNHTYLKIPNYVCPEGRSLLKQLLNPDPCQRLGYGSNGIENLKSHPFFYGVDWEKLGETSK